MKARVNLYLEEFRPVKEIIPLPLILACWIAAVVTIFGFNGSAADKFIKTQQAGQRLTDTYNNLKAHIANLQSEQASRKQDPKLQEALAELESELRAKQILLAELVGREKFKNTGFSQLMDDLAENNDTELWLSKIQVDEQNVYLQGYTLSSDAVPRWVNGLRVSDYFSGRSFAAVQIFPDVGEDLGFILSTQEIKRETQNKIQSLSTSQLTGLGLHGGSE